MQPTYEWDPAKRLSNIAKHDGIDFVSVKDFEWSTAQTVRSDRGGEVCYWVYRASASRTDLYGA